MTNESDEIRTKVNTNLAASMTRIAAFSNRVKHLSAAFGYDPILHRTAHEELRELVIYGDKFPDVANFLHPFADKITAIICCRSDSLVTGGAVGEVFRYDIPESLKKALLACRAGYFVYRDGQWLNGHGESFEMFNVGDEGRPAGRPSRSTG